MKCTKMTMFLASCLFVNNTVLLAPPKKTDPKKHQPSKQNQNDDDDDNMQPDKPQKPFDPVQKYLQQKQALERKEFQDILQGSDLQAIDDKYRAEYHQLYNTYSSKVREQADQEDKENMLQRVQVMKAQLADSITADSLSTPEGFNRVIVLMGSRKKEEPANYDLKEFAHSVVTDVIPDIDSDTLQTFMTTLEQRNNRSNHGAAAAAASSGPEQDQQHLEQVNTCKSEKRDLYKRMYQELSQGGDCLQIAKKYEKEEEELNSKYDKDVLNQADTENKEGNKDIMREARDNLIGTITQENIITEDGARRLDTISALNAMVGGNPAPNARIREIRDNLLTTITQDTIVTADVARRLSIIVSLSAMAGTSSDELQRLLRDALSRNDAASSSKNKQKSHQK